MNNRNLLVTFAALVAGTALLHGGLAENFEAFTAGPAANAAGWKFAGDASSPKHARIVDSGDEFYGKVLRVYPVKGTAPANVLEADFGTPERIVVDFDLRVHGNQPAVTVALVNRDEGEYKGRFPHDRAVFWMMADGHEQSLQVFCGSWKSIARIVPDQWYHLRFVCYFTGENANTYDFYFDGGIPRLQNVPFRNAIHADSKALMGGFYVAGRDAPPCGEGSDNYYGEVDNIAITAVGGKPVDIAPKAAVKAAPATAVASAGVPLAKVDFQAAAAGPAIGVAGFQFGAAVNAPQHAQIVAGDDAHGQFLRVFPSARTTANYLRFPAPENPAAIVAEFDFRSQGANDTAAIALGPAQGAFDGLFANAAYAWLKLDAKNRRILHFSDGWKKVADFTPGQWHHAKVTCRFTGGAVNTFILAIDGKEMGPFPFRNAVTGPARPGTLLIEGREVAGYSTGKEGENADFDNIVVSAAGAGEALGVDAVRVESRAFQSQVLGKRKPYSVLLPKGYDPDGDRQWPVLFLFHGRGRNNTSLVADPAALETLKGANFVVAFPQGDDDWYINSPVNPAARYNDYIEEFVREVEANFKVSADRTQRGLAGWSMGGYGSARFAENHPEDFGALATMIGLLDYPRAGLPEGQSYAVATKTFGNDEGQWSNDNPINFAENLKDTKILIAAADKAFDRTMNQNFSGRLKELGIEHELKMVKGGHSFDAVKLCLKEVVAFMNRTIAEH